MKPYKSGFNQKQSNRPVQSDTHKQRMLAALQRVQTLPTNPMQQTKRRSK